MMFQSLVGFKINWNQIETIRKKQEEFVSIPSRV